jgi:hypothetical protein
MEIDYNLEIKNSDIDKKQVEKDIKSIDFSYSNDSNSNETNQFGLKKNESIDFDFNQIGKDVNMINNFDFSEIKTDELNKNNIQKIKFNNNDSKPNPINFDNFVDDCIDKNPNESKINQSISNFEFPDVTNFNFDQNESSNFKIDNFNKFFNFNQQNNEVTKVVDFIAPDIIFNKEDYNTNNNQNLFTEKTIDLENNDLKFNSDDFKQAD